MTVDLAVIPGLLLLAAELMALAAVGYIVARVALRQTDQRLALAQGLVIGPALWGLFVNFILHWLPGMSGALAGWIVLLSLGIGLAWRAREALPIPPPRTFAGLALAGATVFWVALAGRQLLTIPDEILHTTLPATIRAGAWPPSLSWNPDLNLAYHHGVDLLVALLTPPIGPDLAFATELLGAYAWTSCILVAATLVLQRGSRVATLALVPLLLSAGVSTLVFGAQPTLLQLPVPTGIPAAGLRAALTDVYWPSVALPWPTEQHGSPPNIWKPQFTLAYPLALVVIERVVANCAHRWPAALCLAGLVGFLGLIDEAVAPIVLVVWGGIEAWRVLRVDPIRSALPAALPKAVAGPTLAALLLVGGGGVLTGIVTESAGTGELAVAWPRDPRDRGAITSATELAGGLGLFGIGSLIVAGIAVVLARRDRLVIWLSAASGVFVFAALILRYEAAPHDLGRFDGHARNLALLALMLAGSLRLSALRPRWRYAAAAGIVVLVTWPTIATPARKLGLAVGHGVQLANAQPGPGNFDDWYWWMGRYSLQPFATDRIAAWIRTNAEVNARVLSPTPIAMTVATGRSNAAGLAGLLHLSPTTGPDYLDAIRLLEPSALSRLRIEYVHATDDWTAGLPAPAARWLSNPSYFQPLISDGVHALYRVQPDFLNLEVAPAPGSYEALRRAVPSGSTVYLSPATAPLNTFRAVAVLPHTRLLGPPDQTALLFPSLHLQADIRPAEVGSQAVDLVVTSARLAPSMFQPNARRPIFWNDEIAAYAPAGSIAPAMAPPPRAFSVRLSDSRSESARLSFTATLENQSGEGWTGQDWIVLSADASQWSLPRFEEADRGIQWFAGQIAPQSGTIVHDYRFDPRMASLALLDDERGPQLLPSAGDGLSHGRWVLGLRLRNEYHLVAFVPVVNFNIAQSGDVTYHVHPGELSIRPTLGPIASSKGRF